MEKPVITGAVFSSILSKQNNQAKPMLFFTCFDFTTVNLKENWF